MNDNPTGNPNIAVCLHVMSVRKKFHPGKLQFTFSRKMLKILNYGSCTTGGIFTRYYNLGFHWHTTM